MAHHFGTAPTRNPTSTDDREEQHTEADRRREAEQDVARDP